MLDRRYRLARDFWIRPLIEARQAHLDIICHAENAGHPFCRGLCF
jgi:hypothetical protein